MYGTEIRSVVDACSSAVVEADVWVAEDMQCFVVALLGNKGTGRLFVFFYTGKIFLFITSFFLLHPHFFPGH